MKRILTLTAAALLACTATAQTQTAYLDLYQRGGGQHLRTSLTFDGNPVDLGRHSLGETLNLLAGLGWEVDKTLVGANRVLFFPTRHKFHIILKKKFLPGENPFDGLYELQDCQDDAEDYSVLVTHENPHGKRNDSATAIPAENRHQNKRTAKTAAYQPQSAANNEIRYTTYKKSTVEANIVYHPDFAENVYLYDEQGIISFGHDIEEIPSRAFYGCRELKTVTIPASADLIGDAAFGGCQNLRRLYCMAVTPPELGERSLTISRYGSIYVPAEAVEAYKSADGWSAYADRIVGFGTER